MGYRQKGPATDSHPQGFSRKQDPCSPPPAEQLSRDPLYSPGTRHGPQQLAWPRAQLRASAGPSGEHSPGFPPQGQKWSSAKQRWSTGGIQIIRLLLPGCISQRNLTRGLQPHQAAASTVVAANLLSLPFGMLSLVVQRNDSEQNPLHTAQRTPQSPQPGAQGG